MAAFSLTEALLGSDSNAYKAATQCNFLTNAAKGKVPKQVLGEWLANDHLYIHGYIRGTGRLLSFLQLPESVPEEPTERHTAATKLLDWAVDGLVNIRREEAFYVNTSARYGIDVNLPVKADGKVATEDKSEGLRLFEVLFDSLGPGGSEVLPWLECAVVLWGTEQCYLDAWSGARAQLSEENPGGDQDLDGGALKKEFIPNWSTKEFREYVNRLKHIIDEAVSDEMAKRGPEIEKDLLDRALVKWRELLTAEAAFWPEMGL